MHDSRVHFQLDPNHHIYRGLGKSIIQNILFNVPYGTHPKIGGLDPDFDPKNRVFDGKVSPWDMKSAIFDDFS